MNRRNLLTVLCGAAASLAVTSQKQDWIIVAHAGENLNLRAYSEGALRTMAATAKGRMIGQRPMDASLQCGLEDLRGIVSDARFEDGTVFIKVKWFTQHPVPIGKRIVPWGSGNVSGGVVDEYSLASFNVEEFSAFQEASAV